MRLNKKMLVYLSLPVLVALSQGYGSACASIPPGAYSAAPAKKALRVRMKFIANKVFKKYLMAHRYRRELSRKNPLAERLEKYQLLFKPYTFYK